MTVNIEHPKGKWLPWEKTQVKATPTPAVVEVAPTVTSTTKKAK